MSKSNLSRLSTKIGTCDKEPTSPALSALMSSLAFQFNNKVYNFDFNSFGLYRQNAMTVYEGVMDGVILAREVPTDINVMNSQKLFYLIFTREVGWLQVDITTGENLINVIRNQIPAPSQNTSWADMVDDDEKMDID